MLNKAHQIPTETKEYFIASIAASLSVPAIPYMSGIITIERLNSSSKTLPTYPIE